MDSELDRHPARQNTPKLSQRGSATSFRRAFTELQPLQLLQLCSFYLWPLEPLVAAACFASLDFSVCEGLNTNSMSDCRMGRISGNSFHSFDASSSLLERAAVMTFACSSRVKFPQVKS